MAAFFDNFGPASSAPYNHPVHRFDDTQTHAHTHTDTQSKQFEQPSWSPYLDNGGTVVAVAGADYAAVVADTRLSVGYRIHTREISKITRLTDKCVIASSGMQADIFTLHKILKMRITSYEHDHQKQPSINALAQMLSTILYHKRFFPFYAFNLLAGLDDQGVGAVYGYDAVGSFERTKYISDGSGGGLVMSVLDSQILGTNQAVKPKDYTKTEVIDLIKDVITSVGERDIFTGDSADVTVVDASGVSGSRMDLRKD